MKLLSNAIALAIAILPCLIVAQLSASQTENSAEFSNVNTNFSGLNFNNNQTETANSPQLAAVSYNYQALPTNTPAIVDPTADRSRLNISSGICFIEVPISSLPRNPNAALSRGNGSDPTLSRIQVCCDGYKPNVNDLLLCTPICRNDCPNGICTAADKCECLPGYAKDHKKNCVPTCPIGCPNGICQPDGSCVCNPGYVLNNSTRKVCKPHCTYGCTDHAYCDAPETCHCYRHYKLRSDGTCAPSCHDCKHGTCTAPGVCVCNQGYVRKDNACEPICSRGCINGNCIAPETCGCRPGFRLDASGLKCNFHCDTPCSNGFCSGPNVCTCDQGYTFNKLKRQCKPRCSNGCIDNAECVAPETCNCKRNFNLSPAGLCLPKCESSCVNGTCSANGVCTCNRGYKKKGGVCVPKCTSGCDNGSCIAPETCSCKNGYVPAAASTTCVRAPQCQKPCLNGVCTGRNVCTCNTGYILDSYQPHVCKAHCKSGCPNGYCTSPNFCACNFGFKKRGGKCVKA